MLLDIAKLPTAENSVIRLHSTDNVAVARVPIAAGTGLSVEGLQLVTREAIPAGHKVALRAIGPGELVVRYGQAIGRASQPSKPGGTCTRTTSPSRSCSSTTNSRRRRRPCRGPARMPPPSSATSARTGAWARATTSPWWRPATARRTPPNRSPAATRAKRCRPTWMAWWPFRTAKAAATLRARYRPAPAHPGRRAGPSQCLGRHHPRAGLRGQPDRPLPLRRGREVRAAGRADAAIERRHARRGRGRAPRDFERSSSGRRRKSAPQRRLRRSCWD